MKHFFQKSFFAVAIFVLLFSTGFIQAQQEPKKPIILVHGMAGAINWDVMIGNVFTDNWSFIGSSWDNLIKSLEDKGLEKDKDYFIAFYDWRKSNKDSAKNYLKPVIDKAKQISGSEKVDIIAHSMGGLVARAYVEGDNYGYDVDNLIMMGTPNLGSSDAYTLWEGGYIPRNWNRQERAALSAYLHYLDFTHKTFSNYQSVHQLIPSVQETLPMYDYLADKDTNETKSYSEMIEQNSFLAELNQPEKIDLLYQRCKPFFIAGKDQLTVNNIPYVIRNDDENPLWVDGKPDPLTPVRNDEKGDEVVLSESSLFGAMPSMPPMPVRLWDFFIPKAYAQSSDEYANAEIFSTDHSNLISQSRDLIFQFLDQEPPSTPVVPVPKYNNYLIYMMASPLSLKVISPDGQIISQDINQIPGAEYSSETNPLGFKMIMIPDPQEGDYKVETVGLAEGEYHFASLYLDEQGENLSQTEGEVMPGEIINYEVPFNPEDAENPNPIIPAAPEDITPPTIIINSPQEKNYFRSEIIPVDFIVSDDLSGVSATTTKLDTKEFSDPQIDPFFYPLGEHNFSVEATDKADNSATLAKQFNIIANYQSTAKDIERCYNLGWINNRGLKNSLIIEMKLAETFSKFKMKEKIKNKMIINLMQAFIKEIKLFNKKGKINQSATDLLIEDANYLINQL